MATNVEMFSLDHISQSFYSRLMVDLMKFWFFCKDAEPAKGIYKQPETKLIGEKQEVKPMSFVFKRRENARKKNVMQLPYN